MYELEKNPTAPEFHVIGIESMKLLLIRVLLDTIVSIRFTKKNGEIRAMEATLDPKICPETKGEHKDVANRLIVFDVEKEGWRTVIVSNISAIGLPLSESH